LHTSTHRLFFFNCFFDVKRCQDTSTHRLLLLSFFIVYFLFFFNVTGAFSAIIIKAICGWTSTHRLLLLLFMCFFLCYRRCQHTSTHRLLLLLHIYFLYFFFDVTGAVSTLPPTDCFYYYLCNFFPVFFYVTGAVSTLPPTSRLRGSTC
jgi:hypothetical protein